MAEAGLGTALRKLRERRTLSLRDLSRLSLIDHAYLHRLETGEKTSPSEEIVRKLVKELKLSSRESEIVKWLSEHPDTDSEMVSYVLDDDSIDVNLLNVAAGMRHRGTARPDPATLFARVKKVIQEFEAN